MRDYRVTYRLDAYEEFQTDDQVIKADSMLEAAQKAQDQIEEPGHGTIIAIDLV